MSILFINIIIIIIIIIIIPGRWSKNKDINSPIKSVVCSEASRSLARLQITRFQIPSEEIQTVNDQETHWLTSRGAPRKTEQPFTNLFTTVVLYPSRDCWAISWCTRFNIKRQVGQSAFNRVNSHRPLKTKEDCEFQAVNVHSVGR